jgi:uncharacterized protein
MKVLIYGVTGRVGSRIASEAVRRGHHVTGVARRSQGQGQVQTVTGDVLDPASVRDLAAGQDVVVSAVGAGLGGPDPAFGVYRKAAESLTGALRELAVDAAAGSDAAGSDAAGSDAVADRAPRLLVVGGAGSLEVGPGLRLFDTPEFPEIYRTEALAQGEALDFYRGVTGIRWIYVSPAAELEPGERTGQYRTGGDQLLADADGRSAISMEDYAVAIVDQIETPGATGRRITVAY